MDTLCTKTDITSEVLISDSVVTSIMHTLDDAAAIHPEEIDVINGVFIPTHHDAMDNIIFNIEHKTHEFDY